MPSLSSSLPPGPTRIEAPSNAGPVRSFPASLVVLRASLPAPRLALFCSSFRPFVSVVASFSSVFLRVAASGCSFPLSAAFSLLLSLWPAAVPASSPPFRPFPRSFFWFSVSISPSCAPFPPPSLLSLPYSLFPFLVFPSVHIPCSAALPPAGFRP